MYLQQLQPEGRDRGMLSPHANNIGHLRTEPIAGQFIYLLSDVNVANDVCSENEMIGYFFAW
jgi:hypothetical protein